jgi:hypothetical protein
MPTRAHARGCPCPHHHFSGGGQPVQVGPPAAGILAALQEPVTLQNGPVAPDLAVPILGRLATSVLGQEASHGGLAEPSLSGTPGVAVNETQGLDGLALLGGHGGTRTATSAKPDDGGRGGSVWEGDPLRRAPFSGGSAVATRDHTCGRRTLLRRYLRKGLASARAHEYSYAPLVHSERALSAHIEKPPALVTLRGFQNIWGSYSLEPGVLKPDPP